MTSTFLIRRFLYQYSASNPYFSHSRYAKSPKQSENYYNTKRQAWNSAFLLFQKLIYLVNEYFTESLYNAYRDYAYTNYSVWGSCLCSTGACVVRLPMQYRCLCSTVAYVVQLPMQQSCLCTTVAYVVQVPKFRFPHNDRKNQII